MGVEDMAKQTSYRGCLLGLAVGDAMGYAVDDRSLEQIRADYGPEDCWVLICLTVMRMCLPIPNWQSMRLTACCWA